jgi:hypothetical protein
VHTVAAMASATDFRRTDIPNTSMKLIAEKAGCTEKSHASGSEE